MAVATPDPTAQEPPQEDPRLALVDEARDGVRSAVRDLASDLRDLADQLDRLATTKPVDRLPALTARTVANGLAAARVDLPARRYEMFVTTSRAMDRHGGDSGMTGEATP